MGASCFARGTSRCNLARLDATGVRLAWGPAHRGFAHCVAVYGLSHWSWSQGFAVALDCRVLGVDVRACAAVCGSRNVQH